MKTIPTLIFGRKHRKRSLRLQKKIEKKLALKIKNLFSKHEFKNLSATIDGVSRPESICIMAKELINQVNEFLEKTKSIRNVNSEFYSSFEPSLTLLETPDTEPGVIRWLSSSRNITINANRIFSIIAS
jgi:hypothetical protein